MEMWRYFCRSCDGWTIHIPSSDDRYIRCNKCLTIRPKHATVNITGYRSIIASGISPIKFDHVLIIVAEPTWPARVDINNYAEIGRAVVEMLEIKGAAFIKCGI